MMKYTMARPVIVAYIHIQVVRSSRVTVLVIVFISCNMGFLC
jgi:hypothetical protein